jgi:mannose-6-phosphate isomerase
MAKKLHVEFPDVYKDPNHKPEIAIALMDDFLACYGFASKEVMVKNLEQNPVLAEIFPIEGEVDEQYLRNIVRKMFVDLDTNEKQAERTAYIERLQDHIKGLPQDSLSEHQKLILLLISQYGSSDIGVLFACFFNILRLKEGESFVISPDEPHAYISGDLIECMVNSDNVIRGGLTPKLKDTKTLMELLKYEFKERKQNSGVELVNRLRTRLVEYKTGYSEFMVTKLSMGSCPEDQSIDICFNSLSIAVVLSGSA